MSKGNQRRVIERLLDMAFREEVFVTAVNAIVGWIVYNVLIDFYGFSWPHAVVFGLVGYVAQVFMFRSLIGFMRSIEEEAAFRLRGQANLKQYTDKASAEASRKKDEEK
ncbi:MAG: hypothetical protein QW767_03770 [Thermoprotei archaeon]